MAIARGELHQISYIEETSYGTTPGSPSMLELWHNTESLRPVRNPFESGRALGDRQVGDVRMGRKSGAGDILSELCYENFDNWLMAVIGCDISSDWPVPFTQIAASTISFTADSGHDGGTIDDSGSGLGDISIGDFIEVAGVTVETGNNAIWYVTAAAAGSVSVLPCFTGQTALADKTAGDSVTIDQVKRIANDVTEQSFTVELRYTDITRYHIYRGVVVDTAGITVPPNGIVTCSWGLLAKNYEETATTLDSAPTAATLYSPYDGLSGSYLEGGAAVTNMTGINFNVANNYMLTEALGADEAGEAIARKFRVDGSVTYYKEDDTQSAKFYEETESMLQVTLSDPDSNQYRIVIPRVKYTSLEEGKGDDGPIMSRMNWMGVRYSHNEDLNKTIYIDQL
jgi:hypothetical protein